MSICKVCDIFPQFFPILEIDEEFSQIGMRTIDGVAKDFAGSIFEKFDENRCVAALGEGDGFGIREENIVALGNEIFAYENVKDVECNLTEQISDNLVDERSSFIIRGECSAVLRKCN